MKLYTVVVHYLQMCMKEYGCCPKFKRGDDSTYTFTKRGGMYLVSATPTKQLIEFLAHLTQRVMWAIVTTERPSSVRPLTFHILINSSEATGPIWTKLWWNGPWMAPFQKCVRWSRLPTKMAAKLKIEKRGDAILIVHCCFSISQNELKF